MMTGTYFPAALTATDMAAVALLFASWFGSGWLTERPPAGLPSVSVLMARFRRGWMLHMITRKPAHLRRQHPVHAARGHILLHLGLHDRDGRKD